MGAQTKLFQGHSYPVDMQVELIDKAVVRKYACFHVSFGMDRGNAKGYVSYTSLMTMIDWSGRCHVKSVDAPSLTDLIGRVFEELQTP